MDEHRTHLTNCPSSSSPAESRGFLSKAPMLLCRRNNVTTIFDHARIMVHSIDQRSVTTGEEGGTWHF